MVRIVYFGTPDFAEPALRRLAADGRFDVALVVSQPDRPAGRGGRLTAPPVAIAAAELGLPLYQPETLRRPEDREPLVRAGADLFVVAAFGLIFGQKTLDIPRLGCVNLHASLLPAYRGASPIQSAIAMGESETGVTLMVMEPGLDTGAIISSEAVPIGREDTTASLTESLAAVAADLAVRDVSRFTDGALTPRPQPPGATVTRLLTRADGWIDWLRPAAEIECEVRAFWPWPRTWTTVGSQKIQVHAASVRAGGSLPPGAMLSRKGALVVQCGSDALELERVQPEGRSAMAGAAFAASLSIDDVFGATGSPGPRPPLVVPAASPDGG